MSDERRPLYYTFGNHMHWVDMEWLWGYQVLPDSVRDMLHFCAETGTKGNINFDAVGYEKMAAEAPEALQELRAAVQAGQIEVVGASYGQPYGLFHGGESNVRQRIYGVRTVLRLLGTRPRTFWEEEFDFFPQLPQMLRSAGYEYASLFFQWTWHTPVVPQETLPAVWWEAMDGSTLLAATRNGLNLHQWPEDFAGLLDSPLPREMPAAGIVQWLELMPSPDWMCRSELLLPQLKALMQHPEFEIRPATLSEYLDVARPYAEPRRYTMDDVFHGMSLGKNGDKMRRLSRQGEQTLLAAESLSALAGMFGRPYPSWNVYPTWELEEAWRELLAAQHHDNDECEGLCGFVGVYSYERSMRLASGVEQRTRTLLTDRTSGGPGRSVIFNDLGWSRDAAIADRIVAAIPPFGYRVIEDINALPALPPVNVEEDDHSITLRRGPLSVTVDRTTGTITQIESAEFAEGLLRPDTPLITLEMTRDDQSECFDDVEISTTATTITIHRRSAAQSQPITIDIRLAPERDAVDVQIRCDDLTRPDGRMHAALQTTLAANLPGARLIHDHPYGVSEIRAEGTYLRKYPTGDWMTSPQVFEEVHHPFTALQFLDIDDGTRGVLFLHDGSQALFRDGERVRQILSMYDPWDEDYFDSRLDVKLRIVPHGPITHAERWRLAQEHTRPVTITTSTKPGGDLPTSFGPVWCDATNVAVTAFFRESEVAGQHLDDYAGAGIGFPYVLRLVEFNGEATTAHIRVPAPLAAAYRTDVMGEHAIPLAVQAADAPLEGPAQWNEITIELAPYAITTLYLDLVMGRKVARNLDDYRSVWATIHRVGEPE